MTTVRPTIPEHTHVAYTANSTAGTQSRAKFYDPGIVKRTSPQGPPAPIASRDEQNPRARQTSQTNHNSSLPSLLTPAPGRPRTAQGVIQNNNSRPAPLSASRFPEQHSIAASNKYTLPTSFQGSGLKRGSAVSHRKNTPQRLADRFNLSSEGNAPVRSSFSHLSPNDSKKAANPLKSANASEIKTPQAAGPLEHTRLVEPEVSPAINAPSSATENEASAKALKKFNFIKGTGDPSALAALGDKPSIISKLPLDHQKEIQAARDKIHGVTEPTPVTGSPHPSSLGPVVAPNTQAMHEDYKGEENGSIFGTKVRYLNDQERQAYKVQVKDGLVVDAKGKPFDTTQASSAFSQNKGRAIFAMDKHGNMYMSNEQTSGKFHHSSFMAGGDVAAAGDIRIENGVVKTISRKSGHYKPSEEQLGQFKNQLVQQGVQPGFDIDKNID